MANSSDWLAALAQPGPVASGSLPDGAAPAWLALMPADGADDGSRFCAALPFGDPAAAPPPATGPAPAPPPPPADAAPDPVAQACARAYEQGEAAGKAAAEAEAAAHAAHQRALRLTMRALDEAALGVLADDLAATVQALCEGVLGEAAINRDGLIARCHVAARRIGGAVQALRLHLHPDDIALLGDDGLAGLEDQAGPDGQAGWRIVADAALERGSVLIEGPDGCVADGPAEWRRAIAAALRA